ncbi:MAG: hypothetical protein LBS05_06580 [Tannerellaceae bacterium]|nr:hypothetical protein [Tannerellaceae bacterium]
MIEWQPSFFDKKKKNKDDACDFFHVNIYDIFRHEPEFVEKCTDNNDRMLEKYILKLANPELSAFDQIHILKYENGNYDLHFTGHARDVNDEIIEFINYCTDVLGIDFMHKGNFSENDIRDLKLGAFSRVWPTQIRIENVYYTLSLTLYDIPTQKQ